MAFAIAFAFEAGAPSVPRKGSVAGTADGWSSLEAIIPRVPCSESKTDSTLSNLAESLV